MSNAIIKQDKKKYVLKTDCDVWILKKCKELEKGGLTRQDQCVVRLIKSQLIYDWRRPLEQKLKKILRKYK